MSIALRRAAIAALLVLFASPALADSVSGAFTTKSKQFKPAHVAAFRTGNDTLVVLSANALNREGIAKSGDPYSAAINDPGVRGSDFITFTVDSKAIVTMNASIDGTQNMDSSGKLFGEQGSLVAKCATNTKDQVDCHVTSSGDPRAKWTVDLTFDSAVLARTGG